MTPICSEFLFFYYSHDGKYLTSGSENQCVFLWRTQYESANITARKDRNNFYEAIKGDNNAHLPNFSLTFSDCSQFVVLSHIRTSRGVIHGD